MPRPDGPLCLCPAKVAEQSDEISSISDCGAGALKWPPTLQCVWSSLRPRRRRHDELSSGAQQLRSRRRRRCFKSGRWMLRRQQVPTSFGWRQCERTGSVSRPPIDLRLIVFPLLPIFSRRRQSHTRIARRAERISVAENGNANANAKENEDEDRR